MADEKARYDESNGEPTTVEKGDTSSNTGGTDHHDVKLEPVDDDSILDGRSQSGHEVRRPVQWFFTGAV